MTKVLNKVAVSSSYIIYYVFVPKDQNIVLLNVTLRTWDLLACGFLTDDVEIVESTFGDVSQVMDIP